MARTQFIASIPVILAVTCLCGCALPGRYEVRQERRQVSASAVNAFLASDVLLMMPPETAARLIQQTTPQLVDIHVDSIFTRQPSKAISPATLHKGPDRLDISTGFLDRVDQLVKQLDIVVWAGVGLVVLGLMGLLMSFKIPIISQSGCFLVIAAGMGLFFIPTVVVRFSWVFAVVLLAWFLYFGWQNRTLLTWGDSERDSGRKVDGEKETIRPGERSSQGPDGFDKERLSS